MLAKCKSRSQFRCCLVSGGAVFGLLMFSTAEATNHRVRFDEVMGGWNGDSKVQFIQIDAEGGQNKWGPQSPGGDPRAELAFFDARGDLVNTFVFQSDPPQIGAVSNGLFPTLIATQEFVDQTGLAADFILPVLPLPENHVINRGGKVCFRDHVPPGGPVGPFPVNICVSYGDNDNPDVDNGLIPYLGSTDGAGPPTDALPITNAESIQRFQNFGCHTEGCHQNADFQLAPPAPINANGATVAMPVASTFDQGKTLFFKEPFLGNGRSCLTCHLPQDGFGLRPETIDDLFITNPNDPLFVSEFIPGLEDLEDTCLMREGNMRGLILENVHGQNVNPVFRASPHLMNIAFTAPYGWSRPFGGADDLINFCQGAIGQHFPKILPRNNDPADGPMSNRSGTIEELTFMEEFQNSIRTTVDDGQGPLLTGPFDKDANLTRLIDAFLNCNPGADATGINEGRALFDTRGCINCHTGPFLGAVPLRATGIVDDPGNTDDGCQGSMFDPDLKLPNEDDACAANLMCSPPMAFDTRPLVDVVRVRAGVNDPNLGGFFHDNVIRTTRDSVQFYLTDAFQDLFPDVVDSNTTSIEVDKITLFLEAIIQVDCKGACCLPGGVCLDNTAIGDCEAQCGTHQGAGSECVSVLCAVGLPGACCLPTGACVIESNQCTCELQGGVFQGTGTVCTGQYAIECPDPGACCLPDATCSEILETDCDDQCGTFDGELSTCGEDCCIELARACCLPDDSCIGTTTCLCEQQGGISRGVGTTCNDPAICPAPGACCESNGTCSLKTEEECDAIPCTTFHGDGTDCAFVLCPAAIPQACCVPPYDICISIGKCLCLAQNGVPRGVGSSCSDPAICPSPGACCEEDGTCSDVIEEVCDAIACSTFMGDGTTCALTVCQIQATKACCLVTSCVVTTACDCSNLGGSMSNSATCGRTACPVPFIEIE